MNYALQIYDLFLVSQSNNSRKSFCKMFTPTSLRKVTIRGFVQTVVEVD